MKQYIVDAFANKAFCGNPAAVVILDRWPEDEFLRKIAMENNLSETAFAVKTDVSTYRLRWFTPTGEIDLCGHATLATGYVLCNFYEKESTHLEFETLSGNLSIDKIGERYEMDFPAFELKKVELTPQLAKKYGEAYGMVPIEVYEGGDTVAVFESEEDIYALKPDQKKLAQLYGVCQHATAKGSGKYHCVSRTFAPKCNVPEDPVCGRGHCHFVPYYASQIEGIIFAYQASSRGGELYCRLLGNRVKIAGNANLFSIAELLVTEEE